MTELRSEAGQQRWHERVDRVSDAYGFVLVMTIAAFTIISALPDGAWSRFVGVIVTGFTAVLGLASSHVPPAKLREAIMVVVVAGVVLGAAAGADLRWLGVVGAVMIAGLLLVTIGVILRQVVYAVDVNFRTILGALSAYTMLGLMFSFVYIAVDLAQAASFFGADELDNSGNMLFFSYTTLTTTGYGNLIPAGEPGQSLAVIEMLIGQIFLVTLVARLVSMWRPRRMAAALAKSGDQAAE